MSSILACLDGSSYGASVCEYAAWFASKTDRSIDLLHVDEPPPAPRSARDGESLLRDARLHLAELGGFEVTSRIVAGDFAKVCGAADAAMIVMGKRGVSSDVERRPLGAKVADVVAATDAPICLCAKLFLPVFRAMVVIDADLAHRRAVDFVREFPGLTDVEVDLVVVDPRGIDPEPKINWAREALSGRKTDVYAVEADAADVVGHYMDARGADLVIISRAVLAGHARQSLAQIEEHGVWGWKTPVLIC